MAESKNSAAGSGKDVSKRRAAKLARGILVAWGRLPPVGLPVADEADVKAIEEGEFGEFSSKTQDKYAAMDERAAVEAIDMLKDWARSGALASDGMPLVDEEVVMAGMGLDTSFTGRVVDTIEQGIESATGVNLEGAAPRVAQAVGDMASFAAALAPLL